MSNAIKKILYAFLTIFLAMTAIFFVIRLSPGDPVETILGPNAKGGDILKLRQKLGMDLPLFVQYKNYIFDLLKMNLGKSIINSKEVVDLIKERFGPTLIIAFFSISFSFTGGTFLGVMSGHKKSLKIDHIIRLFTLSTLAFPIFSLAPLLVIIFSIKLNILPVSEWGTLKHSILPILTLTIPLTSVITRVARNKYLEEKNAPFVTVLRSKGLNEVQIILRVVKVCLPTILNVVAIQLSVVLAGTMVLESLYDIPGMGSLLFNSIESRDYPVVQGVIVYSTIIYMIIYFAVDVINQRIDPRI